VTGSLFRSTRSPVQTVLDVHVNALPEGITPPDSFYQSASLASVVKQNQAAHNEGFQVTGGCVCAPAGVDLLAASLALKEQCRDVDPAYANWRAMLRFDHCVGPWPGAGPVSRIAHVRRSLNRGLKSPVQGTVSRAILNDPTMLNEFAAVKLMPQMTGLPDDKALGLLGDLNIPILVHAGSFCPVRWIKSHLLPRTSSPVVLAHLGSWPCSADDLAQAVELAEADKRVFIETSGASIGNFIRHAATRIPEKLMFGSNTPMCAASVQWQHVSSSIQDDFVLKRVAQQNAHDLFGLSTSLTLDESTNNVMSNATGLES